MAFVDSLSSLTPAMGGAADQHLSQLPSSSKVSSIISVRDGSYAVWDQNCPNISLMQSHLMRGRSYASSYVNGIKIF